MVGSVATLPAVWAFADIANGLMAIPNLVSLIALSGVVVAETRLYLWSGISTAPATSPPWPRRSSLARRTGRRSVGAFYCRSTPQVGHDDGSPRVPRVALQEGQVELYFSRPVRIPAAQMSRTTNPMTTELVGPQRPVELRVGIARNPGDQEQGPNREPHPEHACGVATRNCRLCLRASSGSRQAQQGHGIASVAARASAATSSSP